MTTISHVDVTVVSIASYRREALEWSVVSLSAVDVVVRYCANQKLETEYRNTRLSSKETEFSKLLMSFFTIATKAYTAKLVSTSNIKAINFLPDSGERKPINFTPQLMTRKWHSGA